MKKEGIDVEWAEEFSGAITVCDLKGIIVYMNKHSIDQFEKHGGEKLIGTNLLDCHPEPSKSVLKDMLIKPVVNMYTTENKGTRKFIHQSPWMRNGKFAGIIELSLVLDNQIPNHVRT